MAVGTEDRVHLYAFANRAPIQSLSRSMWLTCFLSLYEEIRSPYWTTAARRSSSGSTVDSAGSAEEQS